MSRYTWILDPGHGGLGPGGEYLVAGKQSPQVPPGVYEGEFNRDIAHIVSEICYDTDITITNPGPANMGLLARTKYARGLHKVRKNCVFISIHANAAGRGKFWIPRAHGAVIFHHKNDKRGNNLAKWMLDSIDTNTDLSISRGIKTSRFSVLTGTWSMPSILIECGFMTNKEDAFYMASSDGRGRIAYSIARTIHYFEMNGGL